LLLCITLCLSIFGRLLFSLWVLLHRRYTQFEYALLQDSVRYFAAEGAQLVAVYDTARFLALVDRRLQVSVLGDTCMCVDLCTAL
jgi:hypothetical protein